MVAKLVDLEQQVLEFEEKKYESDAKAKIKSKKTSMGKYYAFFLRYEPIKCLLIIGAILGGIVSIYFTIEGGLSPVWIPLSIMFIGPIGLVVFILILPFLVIILYVTLRIVGAILEAVS